MTENQLLDCILPVRPPRAQEKFQNPHIGSKKGNNWDFKGKTQNWESATKTKHGFLKSHFIPNNGVFQSQV